MCNIVRSDELAHFSVECEVVYIFVCAKRRIFDIINIRKSINNVLNKHFSGSSLFLFDLSCVPLLTS